MKDPKVDQLLELGLPASTTNKSSNSNKKWKRLSLVLLAALSLSHLAVKHIAQLEPTRRWITNCHPIHKETSGVSWKPCTQNTNYSCASLDVPKDYFNASAGSAFIAMLKVPATVPPSRRLGTIFLNPGGPAGSGVDFALRFGPSFTKLLDGRYDLLGFDPRGVGATRPRVECFEDELEWEIFKVGTVLEKGIDIPPDPTTPQAHLHLLNQHHQLLSLQQAAYAKCAESMGSELPYMGTPTVVRDIVEMSRVLEGEETPINFFGGSYGTILGAYLVNMFPSKMGRVLVDGVASSPQWANQHTYTWLKDWLVNTEDAFQWFLRDCSKAGPQACALAKATEENPKDIQGRLEKYLDDLYENPVAVPNGARPGILNSGGARAILYLSTNLPTLWPAIASLFSSALSGNPTPLYNFLIPSLPLHSPASTVSRIQTDLSRVAVSCLDSPPFENAKDGGVEDVVKGMLAALGTSPHFGGSIGMLEPDGGCQFWPASGKGPERYTGPWNATLPHPMLIVSNTADPITPLASGRELNELMGNSSRLVIQNSPGHCSLGSVSSCTQKRYREYFLEGKLPEDGEVCEVDQGYFPGFNADEEERWMGMDAEARGRWEIGQQVKKAWDEWVVGEMGRGRRFL
ncbi:hypothetical protein T439DRAFT_350818 [Meredithblackwellia eburnea MCA 4105]